jgi:hypothetical protein
VAAASRASGWKAGETSGAGGGKLEDFGPLPRWFKSQLRGEFHARSGNVHGGRVSYYFRRSK